MSETLAKRDNRLAYQAYYRRMAAAFLIAADRRETAKEILANIPGFPREDALRFVAKILAEPSQSERVDMATFEAFGLSSDDPETIRWMMREFARRGATGQAAWFAIRLQSLKSYDLESREVVRSTTKDGAAPSRLPSMSSQ